MTVAPWIAQKLFTVGQKRTISKQRTKSVHFWSVCVELFEKRRYLSVRLFSLNMWSPYPTLFTRYFMKRYLLITHYDIMITGHKRCPSAIGKHTHYANCNPSRRSLTKHNPQANNRIANDYNVIVGLFIARICSNNDESALWRLVESTI